jgi:ElaB/YqjD/DUF883 family membrane-anchored ribosome-binding protein
MSDAPKDVRAQIETAVQELAQMRDEIRVKLNLGAMDAKQEWSRLEEKVTSFVETTKRDLSPKAAELAHEAKERAHDAREKTEAVARDIAKDVKETFAHLKGELASFREKLAEKLSK